MNKKFFFLLILFFILLSFSFVYSTKLIVLDNPKNHSISRNDVSKSNLRFVDDSKLKNYSNYRVLASVDNSTIIPYQVYSVPSIRANYLWDYNYSGNNLLLGVIDSGISYSSTSIGNKIFSARDFTNDNNVECIDSHQHGCLVSSIALGYPEQSLFPNYKGVAYNAELVSGKIFDSTSSVPESVDFIEVFNWVTSEGAKYINNSWGSPKYDDYCIRTSVNADGNSNALIWDFYDYNASFTNDLLFIFSAGNEGDCASEKTISNDCSAYNNLCVGSINDINDILRTNDSYSLFSSTGPTDDNRKKPDIVAPGDTIVSEGYSSWYIWSGTSASSPHVAGSAILLSELGLNALEVKSLLINSSDDLNEIGWDKYTGWGYINLENAYLEKDFVDSYEYSYTNSYVDNNLFYLTFYDSNSDYFYLDSDENAKCSLVWRRQFDLLGIDYINNFDLFMSKDNSQFVSNSLVDNVEQLSISNSVSNSFLKVSCLDNCYDTNYSLACSLDNNKIYLDYFISPKTDFYSNYDSNISLHFDLEQNLDYIDFNVDINFDLNIFNNSNSFVYNFQDINKYADYNVDLNSSFYPLSDYNILISLNGFSYDFNSIFISDNLLRLNLFDSISPISEDSNSFYLSDFNLNYDFNFYDNNPYFLDSNLDTNYFRCYFSNDSIYSLDFNAEDYNYFGRFVNSVSVYDVYGNVYDKNIILYAPLFDYNNYYIDFDNNILYFLEGMEDLNIVYYYNENKDYNLILDNNSVEVSKENNVFYYNISIDYNSIVFYDLNRDLNVLSLRLVEDEAPQFITSSIDGADFNILISDFDLNLDSLSVYCDSLVIDYLVLQDNNSYYLSGNCSSSEGTHHLDINVFDLADNFVSSEYSYSISSSSYTGSSGGGGGSSNSTINSVNVSDTIEDIVVPIVPIYSYDNISEMDSLGTIKLDPRSNILYFYDYNNALIIDANMKIYDSNNLIYFSDSLNNFKLNNYYLDKNLLYFIYGDGVLLKNYFYVQRELPKFDINNNDLKLFDSNAVPLNVVENEEQISNSYIYILISALGIIFVVIFIQKKYKLF